MEESVFTFPYQTNENCDMEPSAVGHIISERNWKSTSDFTAIINNYGLKRGKKCEIVRLISPFFSKTIHTILKIFLQHGRKKCR